MRSTYQALLCCALLAVLTACRSYGPQFDPRAQGNATYPSELTAHHFPAVTKLGTQSFSAVGATNPIPSEWLTPPTNFFKLGPGDLMDVEVLGNPSSKSTLTIGPDGKIYYSLLPGLFVWGLTLSEAKDLMEKSMAKYFRDTQEVALSLRAIGSKKVWILGHVEKPGIYLLATPLTVLEAISMAGGTIVPHARSEEMIDLQNSFVMREGKLLPIDFYRLLRKGDMSQNIFLHPDDFIYVKSIASSDVYVLGAVALPNIVSFSDHVSVVSAIASVGGPIKYAHLSQVAIVRGSLAEPKIAFVDYHAIARGQASDVQLDPGDIVYVPFSPFRRVGQLAEILLNEFVSSIALNEGTHAVSKNAAPVGVSIGAVLPAAR
jgi:polysaccharide export outer membrane protein